MEEIIPNKVEKKEEVKKEIVEKQAEIIDFSSFSAAMVPKAKEKQEIHDISKKKEDKVIENYIEKGNKTIQENKEKSKKKKADN